MKEEDFEGGRCDVVVLGRDLWYDCLFVYLCLSVCLSVVSTSKKRGRRGHGGYMKEEGYVSEVMWGRDVKKNRNTKEEEGRCEEDMKKEQYMNKEDTDKEI